jgi:hypothetical protein
VDAGPSALIDKLCSYARVDVPKWLASTQLAASSSTACFRFADKASSGSLEAEQDEAQMPQPGRPVTADWRYPDPERLECEEWERHKELRAMLAGLERQLRAVIQLPFRSLDDISLRERLRLAKASRPPKAFAASAFCYPCRLVLRLQATAASCGLREKPARSAGRLCLGQRAASDLSATRWLELMLA